jgi:ParB family chromosome partitioning protein
MSSPKKAALGRGLSALIPMEPEVLDGEMIQQIPLEQIASNPFQPRQHFDEDSLRELSESIRQVGVLEPVLVRIIETGFELVAGERRFRAAALAELTTIPAVVRLLNDQQVAEMALIENIQREDLNALEEAQAYQRLILEFKYKQEELAVKVGKSRPHISNTLRLLQLPLEVQQELIQGHISMGHARALVTLKPTQQLFYTQLVKNRNLSVRQLENMIHSVSESKKSNSKIEEPKDGPKSAWFKHWESKLKSSLQTKAKIIRKEKGGRIEISYFDEEDLLRILDVLTTEKKFQE